MRETIAGELSADIAAFIRSGEADAGRFDALAIRLFAYQYEHNAPYRRFCVGSGVAPDEVRTWRDIPAAPAAAFKRFALTCAPEADCAPERDGAVFHSSGTTGAETSRHYLDRAALDLYRVSLAEGYRCFVPEWTAGIVALMPPPSAAPHSSLSFMLDQLGAHWQWPAESNSLLWTELLAAWMRAQRKPCTYFGTAFAWVNFFDALDGPIRLPEGCIILETGGFKGRSREVERDELYAMFAERLSVPPSHCVAEYGMSEMASQFYDSSMTDSLAGRKRPVRKVGPYWLRTRVVDPVTGQECAIGQPGLLAHYDLANLNSVLAIQTEDYGVACSDDGFVLLGRAPGAILRGCSLTAEDLQFRTIAAL